MTIDCNDRKIEVHYGELNVMKSWLFVKYFVKNTRVKKKDLRIHLIQVKSEKKYTTTSVRKLGMSGWNNKPKSLMNIV